MNPDRSEWPINSLILTDWAANERSIGNSFENVFYELLFLSLIYDKIFIQDEVFAISNRLSIWFSKVKHRELLEKIFDLDALAVLTLPSHAYPTESLKELSFKNPIGARAQYIQNYSTKESEPFIPSDNQQEFYRFMDLVLRRHGKSACRSVGSQRKVTANNESVTVQSSSNRTVADDHTNELSHEFGRLLSDVLSANHYRTWLNSAFADITDEMADDFVRFIQEPELAVKRIRNKKSNCIALFGPDSKVVFNRSLAYQAAELYSPFQADAMKRLIQTTFAAPFCRSENASGRFSKWLRELILLPSPNEQGNESPVGVDEKLVSVEAHVDVPMFLPELSPDLIELFGNIREGAACKRLRKSLQNLGQDIDFREQVECWYTVAGMLSRRLGYTKEIKIRTSLVHAGGCLFTGAVVTGFLDIIKNNEINLPALLSNVLLEAAVGIICGPLRELGQIYSRNQTIREQIERAVEFRCLEPAVPFSRMTD